MPEFSVEDNQRLIAAVRLAGQQCDIDHPVDLRTFSLPDLSLRRLTASRHVHGRHW
jgi:hypothetical protein